MMSAIQRRRLACSDVGAVVILSCMIITVARIIRTCVTVPFGATIAAAWMTNQVPGVWLLLAQLGKRIFRRSDEDEMGIPMRHFLALGFLRGHEGLSQQALAELMCTDANNLVILLNELEADGLATRRRDPLDRRRHIVEITPAGRKAVARAEKALAPHEADVLSGLTLAGARRAAPPDDPRARARRRSPPRRRRPSSPAQTAS